MNVLRLHTKKPLLMENDDLSPDSATSIEHLWKAGLGQEERRGFGEVGVILGHLGMRRTSV